MDLDRPTRRVALTGAVLASATPALATDPWRARLGAIEQRLGGRLGVLAVDTGAGRRIGWRTHERFAMCSAFKWLLAACVLARVDAGRERLDRVVAYGPSDLPGWAPVTRKNLGKGGLSVGELCAAAVDYSDNGAANLLLKSVGGPAGLTAWLRAIGDPTTRLDRWELALNSSIPGDPRDTTTPQAMVADLRRVLLGGVLAPASRQRLTDWLTGCQTGLKRLRAGLPQTWRVGDKTGAWDGRWTTCNDLAIAWPPGRAPVLIFAFSTEGPASMDAREAAIAEVGRLVGAWASA